MTMDRSEILARLKRLMAMTVENGASEQEAMIAAEKAAKLMTEHGLSFTSVDEIEAEAFVEDRRDWFRGSKGRRKAAPIPHVRRCLADICEICGVDHAFNTYSGQLMFFGAPHATEVAHYLVVIITRAMDREWQLYAATLRPGMAARHRASFYLGISHRIAERLREMHRDQRTAAASAGNDLVIVKRELVSRRMAERFPKVKSLGAPMKPSNSAAVRGGYEAGDRVALNQGITEAHGARALSDGSQQE